MKNKLFIFCLLSFFSCTKPSPNSLINAEHLKQVDIAYISDTKQLSQEQILEKVAHSLFLGESISTELTMKCLELEKERESIQNACLALWLNGEANDTKLEEIVTIKLASSNDLAIIALKKQKLVQTLTFDSLVLMLVNLGESPLWLKLKAMSLWLTKNSVTNTQKAYFFESIQNSNLSLPIEYKEAQAIYSMLDADYDRKIVAQECAESHEGISRLRCWRILSTLVENLTDDKKTRLRLFIPLFNDPDWIFFRRNYPHLARVLENNYL